MAARFYKSMEPFCKIGTHSRAIILASIRDGSLTYVSWIWIVLSNLSWYKIKSFCIFFTFSAPNASHCTHLSKNITSGDDF